jgi:hypothetical protein
MLKLVNFLMNGDQLLQIVNWSVSTLTKQGYFQMKYKFTKSPHLLIN